MAGKTGNKGVFKEVNTPDFLADMLAKGERRERAFRKLVLVTHGPLMHYIKRFVSSFEEAQEVLQEVYMAVHTGIDRFQGKSKLTTWIYGMAHNKVCDRLGDRSWQHQEFMEAGGAAEGNHHHELPMAKSTHWEMSPERWYDLKKAKDLVPQMIEQLPLGLREIYHLRDVQGLGGHEVAEIAEISEEAVRVRLHRARNKIVQLVRENLQKVSQEKVLQDQT